MCSSDLFDFAQVTNALAAARDYPGREDCGVTVWPLRVTRYVDSGDIVMQPGTNDIELLRRSLGFTDPDPDVDKDKSNHIGNVRYGNEPLMLWAACPGMAKPAWIAESILWADRRIGAQSKKPL